MKIYFYILKSVVFLFLLMLASSVFGQVLNPLADASYRAFNDAFLVNSNDRTYYKKALNATEHDGTWTLALDIFGMQDVYERTRKPEHKDLLNSLCSSFLLFNPTPYAWDGWNDDLAWMGLGLARGYQLTGTPNFLTQAEYCFNLAYDRGWNTIFNGGGIWEQQPDMTPAGDGVNKEALSNNPNGKLACLLYEGTGKQVYLDKAIQIYNWSRTHIFNPANGQVYANIDRAEVANPSTAVYNQGSFIDFAAMLYKLTGNEIMLRDAQMAADYVIKNMTTNGIISNTAAYLNTWADEYVRGLGHLCRWNPQLWNTYYPFLKKNADAAWANRRTDLDLSWNGWNAQTPVEAAAGPTKYVSTVALMQYTPTVQSLPGTIQAEDYNFVTGAKLTDDALKMSLIHVGDGLEYIVNIPSNGGYSFSARVAASGASSFIVLQDNVPLDTLNVQSTGGLNSFTTVSTALQLSAGVHSLQLKSLSGNWNIDDWMVKTTPIVPVSITLNSAASPSTTSITANVGDQISFTPESTEGTWAWTGPSGFSSTSPSITLSSIQLNQGGVYKLKHISAEGLVSVQSFTITLNGCASAALVSNLAVNAEASQQLSSATILAGSYVVLQPTPTDGQWTWTGPNGFAAGSRVIRFNSISQQQAGQYTATYSDANGCKSTLAVQLAVTGTDPCSSAIIPYLNVNDLKWEKLNYASVSNGGKVTIGPQPFEGTWKWSGPNGFSSSAREYTVSDFNDSKAGIYQAIYTNTAGCSSTMDFVVGAAGCATTPIAPVLKVNGNAWDKPDSVKLASGDNLLITPPAVQGIWSWKGPNGFSSNSRELSFEKILHIKAGQFVASYIDTKACISSYTVNVEVTGDDYCSTPIVPYFNINDGSWKSQSSAVLAVGDKFSMGAQPTSGAWTWTGPKNFTATKRDFTINNFQMDQSGTYKAILTNNLGCWSYSSFSINPTINVGVPEIESAGTSVLNIYPNPVTTQLWVNAGEQLFNQLMVTDQLGRLVYQSKETRQNTTVLDVSSWPSGMYILKIITNKNETMLKKFVK